MSQDQNENPSFQEVVKNAENQNASTPNADDADEEASRLTVQSVEKQIGTSEEEEGRSAASFPSSFSTSASDSSSASASDSSSASTSDSSSAPDSSSASDSSSDSDSSSSSTSDSSSESDSSSSTSDSTSSGNVEDLEEIEEEIEGADWRVYEAVWREVGDGGSADAAWLPSRAPMASSLSSGSSALSLSRSLGVSTSSRHPGSSSRHQYSSSSSSSGSGSRSRTRSRSGSGSSSSLPLSSSLSSSRRHHHKAPLSSSSSSSSSSSPGPDSDLTSYMSSSLPPDAKGRVRKAAFDDAAFAVDGGALAYPSPEDRYEGPVKDGVPHGKGVCMYGWDGSRYEGEGVEGKREGHGKLTWTDGVVYEGDWRADSRDGYGEQTSAQGAEYGVYKGEFRQGRKNGIGKVVVDGEVVREGIWVNNKYIKDSVVESVLAYPTKEDHYEGFVRERKPHGKGKCVFGGSQANNVYEGDWVDGRMEGKGTYTWPDGNRYVGDFVNNLREGEGTHTYPNGKTYSGQWKKRKRDGPGTLTDKDGAVIYSGVWVDDKPKQKKK